MAFSTKIATCCYCGARAALVLGQGRHELTCSGCGAPLHDLKRLPRDHPGKSELVRPSAVRQFTNPKREKARKKHALPKKHKKRRKGFMENLFEEAIDVIEDIFD